MYFAGCWYHGCRTCEKQHAKRAAERKGPSRPFKKHKQFYENRMRSERKRRWLESLGYDVIVVWEHQFRRMRADDKELDDFYKQYFDVWHNSDTGARVPGKLQGNTTCVSANMIVSGIEEEHLHGVVKVDVCIPHWDKKARTKWADLPPIFKNINIDRSHVGPHMRKVCEERGLLKKPRRMLIGSYYGKDMVLTTKYLRFLIDHGAKVTRLHWLLHYKKAAPFRPHLEHVWEGRASAKQAGQRDTSKNMVAAVRKLLGNSYYGKCLTNVARFNKVRVMNGANARKAVRKALFREVERIADDCYEVTSYTPVVRHELPIIIG